jgi:hypothetical protein
MESSLALGRTWAQVAASLPRKGSALVARTHGFGVRGLSTVLRKSRGPQTRRSALPEEGRNRGEGGNAEDR